MSQNPRLFAEKVKLPLITVMWEFQFSVMISQFSGCRLILRRPAYVASPLFSSSYPNGVECNYTFQYPSTTFPVRALFSLIQLNIESQQDCIADSLSIYDGSSKNDFILDKVCGIRSGEAYMASGREIFTRFSSNANVTSSGFLAYFSAVNISECSKAYFLIL